MARRPPPFAALRALEAACRHRSYSAAAAELDITHSAISQSVRRLEEELGAKLFIRRGSTMEPTPGSLALAVAYAEAAQTVDRAMRQIGDQSPNSLTIRAPAGLARTWLTPLLPSLARRFPEVSLCIATVGAGAAESEISIQAEPPSAGFDAEALSDSQLRAYASPALLRRLPLATPADVLAAPLLIEHDGADWCAWFAAAGLARDGGLDGLRFDDHTGLALEAACRGAGVALADTLSVQAAIDRDELVAICDDVAAEGQPLWAVWRSDHPKAGLIAPLVAWLHSQTTAEASAAPPRPTLARLSA